MWEVFDIHTGIVYKSTPYEWVAALVCYAYGPMFDYAHTGEGWVD
jgi:hypothetical protein